MTPEQLDEIEKLAADGAFKAAGSYALPLVKALREARSERDRYKAALDAELPAAWREDIESLNSCLERIGKERDEARAEVERLREAARQVHALAEKSRADWPRHTAWGALVDIHKIMKGLVE